MSAQLLNGKNLADRIKAQLKKQVDDFKSSIGQVPCLVNIMIGDDASACSYANSQKKVAEHIGLNYKCVNLTKDITQEALIKQIDQLNNDSKVHGIIIHKPVPDQIDYYNAANHVDILKDLEGINVANIGKMLLGETTVIPCTPAAVLEHIKSTGVDLAGKEVVIVGHSDIVGKPLSLLLLRELATVTVCHIGTFQAGKLAEHVKRADILVVAVGKAGLIPGEWIKDNAIVIDVGINQVGSKIVGDVEFEPAKEKASYITPVPGGVGPVTVVMLMKNGIEVFKLQTQK